MPHRIAQHTIGNRTRVFGPSLLFVAFIWSVAGAWAYVERTETVRRQEEILAQLNSAVAEHTDGLLKLTEFSLKAADQWLASRAAMDFPDTREVLPLADDLRRKTDALVEILSVGPDGTIDTIPPSLANSNATAKGRDYYEAQRRGGVEGLFIGAPVVGRKTGAWTIPVTLAPGGSADGRFLIAAIRIDRLAGLHELQRMKPGGAVTIAREDGVILSRAPFDTGVMSNSLAAADNFHSRWLTAERGVYVSPVPVTDGIPRLVSFIKLRDYPVFVSISARMEDVLEPWWRRVQLAIGVAGVLTVLTAGITRHLLRAIDRSDQSSQRFADIAATASDLVWEVSTDRRFTFISNRYHQVLGLEERQIIGFTAAELGWRPADDDTAAAYANAVDQCEAFADLLFVRDGPEGERKIVSVSGRPFFIGGVFGGFRGATTDVTERVRQEEERQAQALRQAQAGKMEALGQLAGGIAHDFNNLLGAILGFAQFLVQDSPADSRQRRYAERIVMAGRRGRGLVQQILTFARRAPGTPVDMLVADLVQETCELLRATLPATTQLRVVADGGNLTVTADRDQLGQVLLNLCINAGDALNGTPGEIVIDVHPTDRHRPELRRLPFCAVKPTPHATLTWSDGDADWIGTGGLTSHDNVSIRVSDSGSGIQRQHQEPLFDLFFTTKPKGGGTGMGLPVVQRIVTEHGGAVVVETRVGVGTTFEVILPRAVPLPVIDGPRQDAATVGIPPLPARAVLVIDDDAGFCEMIQTALERLGHDVVSSRDPVEGLAAVEESPDLWDLVVTDQTMPGMKGIDLVRRVKRANPHIRCILCTGYSASINEPEALAAGADAFCMKPLDLDRFSNLVRKFFAS